MRYGYGRISTDDQNLDRQRVALGREACQEVVEETQSGVRARHRFEGLLARLVAGDELIVTEIDRLGRSTGEVIMLMDELTKRGIVLRILAMPALDITSDDGRLIADIMASFAAHERRRTRRRQEQGLPPPRQQGGISADRASSTVSRLRRRAPGLQRTSQSAWWRAPMTWT